MHVIDLENHVCGDRDFTKYNMKLIQEQHSSQPIRFEGQVYSLSSLGLQPGLGAFTSLFTYYFPLFLGINYG